MLEEKDFIKLYWFNNSTLVTVVNPTANDYEFSMMLETGLDPDNPARMKVEPRKYRVKAGQSERFPGVIANLYLDQMSRQIAQTEHRMDRLVDFAERAKIYETLIVGKDDLLAAYTDLPHIAAANEAVVVENKPAEEEAFAGAKSKAKA